MRPTPGTAILWTLLVPGLAHLLLGRAGRALLAFATSVGIFAAGAAILTIGIQEPAGFGDRVWYFQLFEPFSFLKPILDRIPIQLLPESPNLGSCIALAFLRETPATDQGMYDWLRAIRLPVPHEHIGLFLMGITGVINSLWAVDAHWLAQGKPTGRRSPSTAAFASWVVPGSGHVLVGQKNKGILIGVAVLAMFALGLLLSQGHAVDRPLRPAWWVPQCLFGGGTLFATLVTAPLEEGPPAPWIDHGVAMCAVAGLMNLVVMIDAYSVAEEAGSATPAGARAEPGGAA